jgi:hypothetical protein
MYLDMVCSDQELDGLVATKEAGEAAGEGLGSGSVVGRDVPLVAPGAAVRGAAEAVTARQRNGLGARCVGALGAAHALGTVEEVGVAQVEGVGVL